MDIAAQRSESTASWINVSDGVVVEHMKTSLEWLLSDRNLVPVPTRNDIDSIIDRYAHGKCHLFTSAAHDLLGGQCVGLWNSREGYIHSCLAIGSDLYFDAYGINRLRVIKGHYARCGRLFTEHVTPDDLTVLSGAKYDESCAPAIEDARVAVNKVLAALQAVQRGKTSGAMRRSQVNRSLTFARKQRALALMQDNHPHEACRLYEQVYAADRSDTGALKMIGLCRLALGQVDEAEDVMRHVIEIEPHDFEALVNLGAALDYQGNHAEAELFYRRALRLKPKHADLLSNLGNVLAEQGRAEEAIACFERAIAIKPDNAETHNNLGAVLRTCNRLEETLIHYRQALALRPELADARFNLSLTLLLLGRFDEGWREYAWRWQQKGKRGRPLPLSPWDGLDLSGSAVFLHAEQGLGDELFFLRFASQIKACGASCLTYRPNPKLASILARVGAIDRFATPEEGPSPGELVLSIGDLPGLLGMKRVEQIPPPLRLNPLPERLETIREKLVALGPAPYVGVTWRAGSADLWGPLNRSVPIEKLAQVFRGVPGTVIILQRLPTTYEIEMFRRILGRPAHDLNALNEDLESMLALLALLDDYVGVSNTNTQLRAGVGKTARVLVTAPPDWRWMAEGNESPWFPGFRAYRQGNDGGWDEAFQELAHDCTW